MQLFLKVLVHHVNHSVAESPKEKQRADDAKGECHALAVVGNEHALLIGTHVVELVRVKG
jgi:hypothetical protein